MSDFDGDAFPHPNAGSADSMAKNQKPMEPWMSLQEICMPGRLGASINFFV